MDQAGDRAAQGRTRRAGNWCLALVWLSMALPVSSTGAEDPYQIKAAFIFNFTKFVTWPADMEQQGGDLRLCLHGGNPFGDYVFQLEGRKVRNFNLRVVEPESPASLAQCHILHLMPGKGNGKVLNELAGEPVLTVGDYDSFASQGGSIQLLSEQNHIRFDVNLQRIKASGLEVSSRLLHLARQVR